MGKLVSSETYHVTKDFGSPYGEYEIDLQRYWSADDQEYLVNAQLHFSVQQGSEGQAEMGPIEIKASRIALASRVIKGWNVTDEKDKPIPVDEAKIRRLPDAVLEWILAEWQAEQDRQKKALN